jgi:hypothetical protein
MASAYVVTLDHVEAPSSPTVAASAQYGDNGPANGPDPEYSLVTSSAESDGRTTWNPDYQPDGSWDSGLIPVGITIVPDGSNDVISWTVNGEAALTQTVPSIGSVSAVEIVAGTQINGSAEWSDVAVSFSNGTTTDDYSASGASPSVDTTTATNPDAEQELWVIPAGTGDTTVSITGDIRFTTPPDSYPNPDDLFADVFVFT